MSKTIYIAGESRVVDAVNIPKDKDKTGYERFVPEGTVPDGYVPEGTVPDGYVPEGTVPDGYVPEGTVPDGYVPEGTVPDGYVPEGTLPEGAVIPNVVVTDMEAVAPKAFASGTYLKNGMTVSAPGVEPPTYDTPTVTVSVGLTADGASVKADASAVANGKTGTGSATKALSAMGLVKPAVTVTTKKTYHAGDVIAAGTYLKLGAEVAAAVGGLPFVAEYDYQTYTPSIAEGWVTDDLTFSFSQLTDVPDMIMITSGQPKKVKNYDFGGCILFKDPFGMLQPGANYFAGYLYNGKATYSAGWTTEVATADKGITNVTKNGFTYVQPTYSSSKIGWRAGWTYHIIAIRLKIPG